MRREPSKSFQALCEVVGGQESGEVVSKLIVAVIMVAPDGGFFQGSVHPLDLAVRPRVVWFGEPVFDPVLPAAHIEHMPHISSGGALGVSWREGELNAIVSENRVDFVRDGFNQGGQKGGRGHAVCFFSELGEGKFTGPIDCHEQEELSFLRLNLSNINVKIADGVGLNAFLAGLSPSTSGRRLMPWR